MDYMSEWVKRQTEVLLPHTVDVATALMADERVELARAIDGSTNIVVTLTDDTEVMISLVASCCIESMYEAGFSWNRKEIGKALKITEQNAGRYGKKKVFRQSKDGKFSYDKIARILLDNAINDRGRDYGRKTMEYNKAGVDRFVTENGLKDYVARSTEYLAAPVRLDINLTGSYTYAEAEALINALKATNVKSVLDKIVSKD